MQRAFSYAVTQFCKFIWENVINDGALKLILRSYPSTNFHDTQWTSQKRLLKAHFLQLSALNNFLHKQSGKVLLCIFFKQNLLSSEKKVKQASVGDAVVKMEIKKKISALGYADGGMGTKGSSQPVWTHLREILFRYHLGKQFPCYAVNEAREKVNNLFYVTTTLAFICCKVEKDFPLSAFFLWAAILWPMRKLQREAFIRLALSGWKAWMFMLKHCQARFAPRGENIS